MCYVLYWESAEMLQLSKARPSVFLNKKNLFPVSNCGARSETESGRFWNQERRTVVEAQLDLGLLALWWVYLRGIQVFYGTQAFRATMNQYDSTAECKSCLQCLCLDLGSMQTLLIRHFHQSEEPTIGRGPEKAALFLQQALSLRRLQKAATVR